MKLLCTPRSHFSRKVRILLDAWGEAVELVDAGNVADNAVHDLVPNPLVTVPVLVDGGTAIFDSDHIAQHLTRRRDEDPFGVLTTDSQLLNARAVCNGVMAAEVEVILAERTGIDVTGLPRFQKKRDTMRRGLAWLERHADLFDGPPSYAGFHLVAMWDHLALYGSVPLTYARLRERVESLSTLDYVAKSAPDGA